MANKSIFGSKKFPTKAPPATVVNEAGGKAYDREDREKLAQLVMTGFISDVFYVSGEDQLKNVLDLAQRVETKFLAQLAVEARERGYMKDTPALLCAILTTRGDEGRRYLRQIFNRVIDNGKMLRNFVQILRSGQVGRKSLGTAPKNLVRAWFNQRSDEQVFRNSVGNDPSMADIVKMVHPRPATKEREALFAYFIGKEVRKKALPPVVRLFEDIKEQKSLDLPAVQALEGLKSIPMEMLAGLDGLDEASWVELAKNMSWTQLRMNLNTLARHGVFKSERMVKFVAETLRDTAAIRKAKVYPYQIFTTIMHAGDDVPRAIHRALEDALEVSLDNIPDLEGKTVFVFPDVSGSMSSPITGNRGTATSKMRYVDVAGLFAAAMARKGATVWAVDISLHPLDAKASASVADMAKALSQFGGGGTALSIPLVELNRIGARPDLIVYFSDNESWADGTPASPTYSHYGRRLGGTSLMHEFTELKKRSPKAKMVCVDMTPNTSKQASEHKDVLNIGGFSDRVFDVIGDFLEGRNGKGFWVSQIEKVEI